MHFSNATISLHPFPTPPPPHYHCKSLICTLERNGATTPPPTPTITLIVYGFMPSSFLNALL